MSLNPIEALFDVGMSIISRVWPDPKEQADQVYKLQELKQRGDLAELSAHIQLMSDQAKINLEDAKSTSWFQKNWRPAIGWVGAVSLALTYIPKALVMTYVWSVQAFAILNSWDGVTPLVIPIFPDLGVSDVIGLLMSMLGVAAMRSYDKQKGTDTKQ